MRRRRGLKKSVGVLLLLLLFAPVMAENTPSWYQGERLNFRVGWGFVTAGRAVMEVFPKGHNLLFRSVARNNGAFQSVYPVKDTIRTWVSREGLIPSSFSKILNEGGWHSRTIIDFDQAGGTARLADSVLDQKDGRWYVKRSSDTTVTIEPGTHCIISAFYKIRTLDLKPGEEYYFNAVSGKKKYRMKVICHRYETIEVDAGKFKTVVVEPVLADDGIFKAKGKLTIWLSRDERRLPVLMKSKIAVGSIFAELESYK